MIGSRTLDWFLSAGTECEDISWPIGADVARFDQYKSRSGHGLIRSESPEAIELVRVPADGDSSRHSKPWRIGRPIECDRPNLKAGKPRFGTGIHLQEDVDRRSEPIIDDQKVFFGICGNWRLLVRRDRRHNTKGWGSRSYRVWLNGQQSRTEQYHTRICSHV